MTKYIIKSKKKKDKIMCCNKFFINLLKMYNRKQGSLKQLVYLLSAVSKKRFLNT